MSRILASGPRDVYIIRAGASVQALLVPSPPQVSIRRPH